MQVCHLEIQRNIANKSAKRYESGYLWGMEDMNMYLVWELLKKSL